MSIQSDLFQQLALIRKRRRAGLPVDWRTMAVLKPAPVLTLILDVDTPSEVREILLCLDSQTYRRFELILINRGAEGLESLLQDICLPVTYLHLAGRDTPAADLATRFGRSRRMVQIERGSTYPLDYTAKLIEAGAEQR